MARPPTTSACETVGSESVTCLDIDASAMIADPSRGLLYVVVTGKAADHPNELVVVDAESASVESAVVVGSNPESLALSEDATTLWVGLRGALGLREIDVRKSPPVPRTQYSLPQVTGLNEVYAQTIATIPGEPKSVAISLREEHLSPGGRGVAVLDSGVPRSRRVDDLLGVSWLKAGPPGFLFGFADHWETLSIAIDEEGLTATTFENLVLGPMGQLTYDRGFVFATSGQVLDVTSPEEPVVAGAFPHAGLVVPHGASSEVIMLSSSFEPAFPYRAVRPGVTLVLRRLSLTTFEEESTLPVDGDFMSIRDFVEPVPGIFAFIHYQAQVTLDPPTVRGAVVLVSAPELAEPPP
jgi:hypothetical protein